MTLLWIWICERLNSASKKQLLDPAGSWDLRDAGTRSIMPRWLANNVKGGFICCTHKYARTTTWPKMLTSVDFGCLLLAEARTSAWLPFECAGCRKLSLPWLWFPTSWAILSASTGRMSYVALRIRNVSPCRRGIAATGDAELRAGPLFSSLYVSLKKSLSFVGHTH